MSLEDQIERLIEGLRQGRFTSEAAVSQGAVLPTLNALDWPVFDTAVVIPEFSVEGRRVDFALCHPANKPAVFVEVKRVGLTEGADRQLFEYAFHVGVPMAILTDGQEWSFYLPGEQGNYAERRVYKLDLLERDISESCERLQRYLGYTDTCSGQSIQAARSDYRNVARGREIQATLPQAWEAMLQEQDSLLLELLADKVEDICGYKPELDACGVFLETLGLPQSQPHLPSPAPSPTLKPPKQGSGRQRTRPAKTPESFLFTVQGHEYKEGSARKVMTKLFELLAGADPQFLERFAARKHGRKRRYLARERAELYPGRPDLAELAAIEVSPGWWLGTNYSRREIQKIIDLAKEVVNPDVSATISVAVNR